ncbi:hypothetical protein A7R75_23025 [Mycolicibacterium llatzerense]|nr:hypothetical protein [Mycolicibacterium llatzerense]
MITAMATIVAIGYLYMTGIRESPLVVLAIAGIGTMLWVIRSPRTPAMTAAFTKASTPAPSNETDSAPTPPPERRLTAADIYQTRDDLLAQWGAYRLDIEAWYITKPLLHDTTGTVTTTVAYQRALQDLITAVDNLSADPQQSQIDDAGRLADIAWAAWHDADDYASRVGLGDRSPTERAALQRLGKLVERLTRSAAADPELPNIKRAIQECLDKITTVSASWADIAALPAIESRGLLPQIPTGVASGAMSRLSQRPASLMQPMSQRPVQRTQLMGLQRPDA